MNINDFAGFHFLPPSIHLPPALQPVGGASVDPTAGLVRFAEPLGGASGVLQHPGTTDHVFPLAIGPG